MSKELTGYPSIDRPWLKYYDRKQLNEKPPEKSIYQYMYDNNYNCLDDIAIVYFNKKISFEKLFQQIDMCAKGLLSLGVRQGDIVTVALPSIPEVLYIVYALNKIGAVANMVHPLAGGNEICFYINEVNSKITFIFEEAYEDIKEIISTTNVNTVILVSASDSLSFFEKQMFRLKNKKPKLNEKDVFITWQKFISQGNSCTLQAISKNIDMAAIISHTGGTTGEPKGVVCSDRNINSLIWQIGLNWDLTRQEKYLSVLPPFINYSLVNSMLEPLAFGFQVILIPLYKADKFDVYIKKYHPNVISSIPDYWEAILENKKLKNMDLSCLKHLFYGGEAMSIQKENAVNELLSACGAKGKLGEGLGCTEMVSAATITYENCNVSGSVGIPLIRVNCKIINPDSYEELSYNQVGEICFSGDTLMLGYYQKPDATDEVIKVHLDQQKWLHTGDLGYIDNKGILFINGRIKRILKTMGPDGMPTKMFPDRIEKVVMQQKAVDLCCVIGIPDAVRVHYPRAYVVLNSEYSKSEETTRKIIAACRESLPIYMVPEEIVYCDSLPRTERGKVDYRALEKEAAKQG